MPLDFFLLFDMLHLALKVILDFTVFLKLEHMLAVSFDLVLMHVIVDDLAPESILLLVLNGAKHADSATSRGSAARVIALDRGEVLLASPPVWCKVIHAIDVTLAGLVRWGLALLAESFQGASVHIEELLLGDLIDELLILLCGDVKSCCVL